MLILGFYIAPYSWVPSALDHQPSPDESRQIAYQYKLKNGINLYVQRQGMVVASFPKHLVPDGTRERKVANLLFFDTQKWALNFFNAFRCAMDNSLPAGSNSWRQAILDTDIYVFDSLTSGDPYDIASTQAATLLDQARAFRGNNEAIGKIELGYGRIDNDYFMRMPLSIKQLDDCCALLDQLIPDFDKNIELFALLNEAAFLIQQGDFHRSLMSSWAVCEHLIGREWEDYVDSTNQVLEDKQGRKTINSDRRNELVKGAKWTAYTKLEALELAKAIPFHLFDDLRIVRGARNKWLHTLEVIKLDAANLSLGAAHELMSRKLGVELTQRSASYIDASVFENLRTEHQ